MLAQGPQHDRQCLGAGVARLAGDDGQERCEQHDLVDRFLEARDDSAGRKRCQKIDHEPGQAGAYRRGYGRVDAFFLCHADHAAGHGGERCFVQFVQLGGAHHAA